MSTHLHREQGELLHRQLFRSLREQIRRGVFPVGSAIPPEDQLGRLFGVSRITVRRAVSDLVDAGWLEKRMGRGTFVRVSETETAAEPALTFVETLMQRSRQTQITVLEVCSRLPPANVAAKLQQPADQEAVFVSRLRSANSVPLIVTDVWAPMHHARQITAEKLRRQGISEILLAEGIHFEHVTEEITAVAADPHVATLLKVDIAAPLLKMVRMVTAKGGVPVMHLTAYLTSERSKIVFDLDTDLLNTPNDGRLVHNVNA